MKGCNIIYTGKDGKQKRDMCTCVEDEKVLERLVRQKEAAKKRRRKSREQRTPEEKTSDRIRKNELRKRRRNPRAKLKAIFPCKQCKTLFKRQGHADKCKCQAVFVIFVHNFRNFFSTHLWS